MKTNAIAIVAAGVIIGAAILFSGPPGGSPNGGGGAPANNVVTEAGRQIVTLSVRGGYRPQTSQAAAGVPTVLRFHTDNTYDCSASIRIPALGIAQFLPASGDTDINLGTPAAGTLRGTCGMGMYSFVINFK